MSALTLPDDLRAITMYAEYAHAVVTGDKTIETRSRPCNYRGWVGIHAAASFTHIGAGECRELGRFEVERDGAGLLLRGMAWPYRLPLGAIVAVARLTDCVPMTHTGEEGAIRTLDLDDNGSLWLVEPQTDEAADNGEHAEAVEVTDQLPYGEYEVGRCALLLEDVTRLRRPVPAKGNQAVPWRVPEDVAAKVREQVEGLAG